VNPRLQYREGLREPTSAVAPGMTQANLVAVPADWAFEMLLFAQRNPKPCPVLEVLEAGQFESRMAPGSDVRTDLPAYHLWRDGVMVEEMTDGSDLWDGLVTFLIGCSFTFENPLAAAGIPIRHQELGRNVPMYRTNRACVPAGRLHGDLVVSMRPVPADRVADAVTISGRYPAVHGAPVHVGDPSSLGVSLDVPDYGDPPVVKDGELPVFWACGVTPQAALLASKPPFAITHAPGHMFVTDVPDLEYMS